MKIIHGLNPHQVLQRKGKAGASAVLKGECQNEGPLKASILAKGKFLFGFRELTCGKSKGGSFEAKLKNIPAGGPYELILSCGKEKLRVTPFFCGDVWVLAGRSNMEGVGNMSHPAPTHPLVRSFSMRRVWRPAADPLHILGESPDACHNNGIQCSAEKSEFMRKTAQKGVGAGLFFAREMVRFNGVPQGLICTAHGGTSMEQWNPENDTSKGASLYSSMKQSVEETGQPVAGILWYQGESDAGPSATPLYTGRMAALVKATRRDFKNPKLPWVVVQISKVFGNRKISEISAWNSIQDQQRRLPATIPYLETVSAIDLPLDDAIHIGALGFPRLAKRMADAAQSLLQPSAKNLRPPQFNGTKQLNSGGTGWRYAVSYKNIQGSLRSAGEPSGFTMVDGAGAEIPIVFKTVLEGSQAILDICPPTGLLPDYCRLSYGYGVVPYCNITDERDAALPVFGPIPICAKTAATDYLIKWDVSEVLDLPSPGNAIPTPPQDLATNPRTYNVDGFVNEHTPWIGKSGFCYFKSVITLSEAMNLELKMGYDGPFALWLDDRLFFEDLQGSNPCLPDKAGKSIKLKAGEHRIAIGMDLAHGKSWGFFLRMIRKDVTVRQITEGNFVLPKFPA